MTEKELPKWEEKTAQQIHLMYEMNNYGEKDISKKLYISKSSAEAREKAILNKLKEGWKDIRGDFTEIEFMNTGRDIRELIIEFEKVFEK